MYATYLVFTVLAAAANLFSATLDFVRFKQILVNMARVGVSESWLTTFGVLKAAGAVGLLVGIVWPLIGAAAAGGLVLFFIATIITHLRGHDDSFGRAELQVAESQVKVNATLLDDVTRQYDFAASLTDKSAISAEELTRRRCAMETAQARLDEAKAQVDATRAQIKVIETEIERSTVRASINGEVLQVKIHPGEFAPAGVTGTPLVLLGRVKPLNIRVDVDEQEAWRVQPGAKATASVRGEANLKTPLTFVRFEPFVVPKKSLTGDSTERVDTRVLQVIYRMDNGPLPLFVGQQMDVFIEAPKENPAIATK